MVIRRAKNERFMKKEQGIREGEIRRGGSLAMH